MQLNHATSFLCADVMNPNRVLTAILFIGACCSLVYAQNAPDKPPAEPKALSEALTKVRQLKAKSYHYFLRDAAQILPPVCVGQPWSDVTTVIEKQMCPMIDSRDNGEHLQRYYLAQKQAVSFPNGRTLDAYVWLSGRNADGFQRPSRPEKVFQANIMLADEINADYEDLVKQHRYPRGSILDVVLRSPEVQREGLRWPIVKRVLVNYGSSIGRSGISRGFDVTVQFTASLENEIGEKRMYFFVSSGLAPIRDDRDRADGVASTDTLGDVYGYGGNEWWRGEAADVKANQKKYLKSKR